jgi:hypothetical protein
MRRLVFTLIVIGSTVTLVYAQKANTWTETVMYSFHGQREPAAGPSSLTQAVFTTVFQYPNFNSLENLAMNGAAQTVDHSGTTYLELSAADSYTESSVWYAPQVNVAQGFVTRFHFQVQPVRSSGVPADGFAFVIQNNGLSALGKQGGYLGYQGIAESLAVEFDTFANEWDPNDNHVAIQSCGTESNTSDHSRCNLGIQPNLPITLADGKSHECTISYAPDPKGEAGTMQVRIDNQLVLTSKVNLQRLLGLPGNDAWIGFSAGTGADWEIGVIQAWSYVVP